MSDTESHQAYIDASEASIPAENGPREVANDPPPLGSAEERENDPGVAARTRLQRRLQNVAGADIIDRARIAAPPTRSDPPEESTSAHAAASSAPTASSSLIAPARIADPPTRSDPPEEFTSVRAAASSESYEASSALRGDPCSHDH